jgi:hypothetical protein
MPEPSTGCAGTHPQAATAIYNKLGEAGTQLAQLAATDTQGVCICGMCVCDLIFVFYCS